MSNHLTSEQRYEIYLGLKRGWRKSRIAREIGVHPSTVCREIERNSTSHGEYVWLQARKKSEARKHKLPGNHRKPPELCLTAATRWIFPFGKPTAKYFTCIIASRYATIFMPELAISNCSRRGKSAKSEIVAYSPLMA